MLLIASTILRGSDLIVTESGIRDAVRDALLPLWNTYYFLALYANQQKIEVGATGTVTELGRTAKAKYPRAYSDLSDGEVATGQAEVSWQL